MNRRQFFQSGALAGLAGKSLFAAEVGNRQLYDLRVYELRTDIGPSQLHDFFRQHYLPILKDQGLGPIGCFNVVSGLNSPSLVLLIGYSTAGQLKAPTELIPGEGTRAEAWKAFENAPSLPFVRYQSTLLRAFAGHPRIENPPLGESEPPHLFELRRYEAPDLLSLKAKIEMFDQEEIEIFRRCGFLPVFFGEAVFGDRLPHLTYLIAYRDMAARDKAWETFRVHPDWIRIKDKPEWANAVSSIHAAFLSPTDYSDIR